MSTKKRVREKRREKAGHAETPLRKRKERDCGTCSLCLDLDEHIELPSIRCGVIQIEAESDDRRVGLSFLHPDTWEGGEGCLWRRGIWGRAHEHRPDRTGVVPWLMRMPCRRGDVCLVVRPDQPNSWRRSVLRKLLRAALLQGRRVFINDGTGPLKFLRPGTVL